MKLYRIHGPGRVEEIDSYPLQATARAYARHSQPGVYEMVSLKTGLLVERFEVCGNYGRDLIPLWPEPDPPEPMIAALFAA